MFQVSHPFPLLSALLVAASTAILYIIGLGIWRLYFSPLAKFPGPKLAGLTYWYEFYYDFYQRKQFMFKIQDLHKRYGPIIRINPHELHVSDAEFYPVLYARGSNKRNRDPTHTAALTLDDSVLASPDHDLHRRRRAALNQFFSMGSAKRLLPLVQERIETLIAKLEELKDTGTVVNLVHAFSALSNDIIQEYCFGVSAHRIEQPNFDPSYHVNVIDAAATTIVFRHFPIIVSILFLPTWLLMKMDAFASQAKIKFMLSEQVEQVRANRKGDQDASIFHALLESDLPESEKSTRRLVDEATTVVGAGSHTVAWAVSVGSYYILSNPAILTKLKAELQTVDQDRVNEQALLSRLEKLPYLTGVVKECLRLSHGVSLRIPRIAPHQEMRYKDWIIPAGTSVGMTAALMHLDPANFPEPERFMPERWVDDASGRLDKYLAAFSGGSRICLGINLAWAELYLIIASFFGDFGVLVGSGAEGKERRVEGRRGLLELFETDVGDVACCGDNFFPQVKEGSQGVRVLIKS